MDMASTDVGANGVLSNLVVPGRVFSFLIYEGTPEFMDND